MQHERMKLRRNNGELERMRRLEALESLDC